MDELKKDKEEKKKSIVYNGKTIELYQGDTLLRVADITAENPDVEPPLCKFCSRPMQILQADEICKEAGYTCDCRLFQYFLFEDAVLQQKKNLIKEYEAKLEELRNNCDNIERIKSYIGKKSDYYNIVYNAVQKKMNTKLKLKKEKIVSFEEAKNNKDMVDETRSVTEKYYFYPLIL